MPGATENESGSKATAGSRSQVNPARPITTTQIAAAASPDHRSCRLRRRALSISPRIGARVNSSRSPEAAGPHRSGRERHPRGLRPRVLIPSPPPGRQGSYLGASAWPSAPPHRACRAGTPRPVPGSGGVLRVESSGPLPLLQHQAQRLQTVVEAATHGANRDTGLGGDLRAGPVTIVGLHYRMTVVWT